MNIGIDREYEPNLEDEREEDLSDEPEKMPPPTIDPDERIEAPDEDDDSDLYEGLA